MGGHSWHPWLIVAALLVYLLLLVKIAKPRPIHAQVEDVEAPAYWGDFKVNDETAPDWRIPCVFYLFLWCLLSLFVRLAVLDKRAPLSNRISAGLVATSWKSVQV
jgi:hypothetical protein